MALENNHAGQFDAATGQFVSASRPLTQGEQTALSGRLNTDPAGRGYKNADGTWKAAQTIADLVNGTWAIANPTPQGTVALTSMAQQDVITLTSRLQAKRAAAMLSGTTLSDAVIYLIDVVMPNVCRQESLDLTDPQEQQMLGLLEQADLLTTDEVTALTNVPDPSWQAQLVQPSDSSLLFTDPPLTIEASDVQAVTGVA